MNPINPVSRQSPGVDASHNNVLLSSLHLCDDTKWFYSSRSVPTSREMSNDEINMKTERYRDTVEQGSKAKHRHTGALTSAQVHN